MLTDQIRNEIDSLHPQNITDRRSFLVASAAAGIATAAGPVQAQTMIVTPMTGLQGGDVLVKTYDGGVMPAYVAMPKKAGRFPVVLVCQEIFGVHEHIKDVCRRLAKAGYFAIAPELYHRQGDPRKFKDTSALIRDLVAKVPDAQVMKDFDACVAYAEGHAKANASKLAITGFCYGGRVTWLYAAHSSKVKAGVAWYGRLVSGFDPAGPNPVDLTHALRAPVLGLYGGADTGIPVADVERMRAGLRAFGKDRQSMIHVYEGAPHAFLADYRPSYRREAAEDGWKRMLAWFRKHGVA
jgi:carboxymethylenebutenolidase